MNKIRISFIEISQGAIQAAEGRLTAIEELSRSSSPLKEIGLKALEEIRLSSGIAAVEGNSSAKRGIVISRIKRWDVRNVATLIDVFPGIVPSALRDKQINLSQDEGGKWIVEFDLRFKRPNIVISGEVDTLTMAMAKRLGSSLSGVADIRLESTLETLYRKQEVYAAQVEACLSLAGSESYQKFVEIHNEFNNHLYAAALCFYLDTSDYNFWRQVKDVIGLNSRNSLWFSKINVQTGNTKKMVENISGIYASLNKQKVESVQSAANRVAEALIEEDPIGFAKRMRA